MGDQYWVGQQPHYSYRGAPLGIEITTSAQKRSQDRSCLHVGVMVSISRFRFERNNCIGVGEMVAIKTLCMGARAQNADKKAGTAVRPTRPRQRTIGTKSDTGMSLDHKLCVGCFMTKAARVSCSGSSDLERGTAVRTPSYLDSPALSRSHRPELDAKVADDDLCAPGPTKKLKKHQFTTLPQLLLVNSRRCYFGCLIRIDYSCIYRMAATA